MRLIMGERNHGAGAPSREMRRAMWRAILIAAGMLWGGAGGACTLRTPFDMAQIAGAELVVVGRVTAFEALPVQGLGAALVTVAIEESLKGGLAGEVILVWNGGMAQGPSADLARGRVLIGAMPGGRIAVSDRAPDARPDLPSIIQPYCGEVWMQPATRRSVAAAREALE
jgi:hypothetical protein